MSQIDPKLAIDLDKVKLDAAEKEAREKLEAEAQAAEAQAAMERYVKAWDNAMNRAFKGIFSRPQRHAMMRQAAARQEREAAEAQA